MDRCELFGVQTKIITMTTPYELVTKHFTFPFTLYPLQVDAVNTLAVLDRGGLYAQTGTGKTAMGTAIALYKWLTNKGQCIITMPPILQTAWLRWLKGIPGVTAVAYRGTPAERKLVKLDAMFTLMSIQIFKQDYEYLSHVFQHKTLRGVIDEADCIKNVASANHKKVRDCFAGRELLLMTATPINQPGDAYAYVKLLAPQVYRSQRAFENIHVADRDFFGNVKKWQNLELMQDNMKINSVRMLKRDVLPNLPIPIYTPIYYDLSPEHMALYNTLSEQQLLELENGGKIDATSVSKLYTCLQQIVMNFAHFSGNPERRSSGFDVIDQVLKEINAADPKNGGKLIIFANYKMTIASLTEYLAPFGAVKVNSTVSPTQKEANIERFKYDPACRVAVIQPGSGGKGVDGLQAVCSDMFFVEEPLTPTPFEQAVGRLDRDGQIVRPNVRLGVAVGTIQVKLHKDLLYKDEVANFIQGGFENLRTAIHGEA